MKNYIEDLNKAFDSRIRLGIMSILMVNDRVDFGTDKGGVCKYNMQTSAFEKINSGNTFKSNRVFTIFKDSKGKLWFGTLGGYLTTYDGKKFHTYDDKDGLNNKYILC